MALVHLILVVDSTFGFAEWLPTRENGARVLDSKKVDSAIVYFGWSVFWLFYVFKSGLITYNLSYWILNTLVGLSSQYLSPNRLEILARWDCLKKRRQPALENSAANSSISLFANRDSGIINSICHYHLVGSNTV